MAKSCAKAEIQKGINNNLSCTDISVLAPFGSDAVPSAAAEMQMHWLYRCKRRFVRSGLLYGRVSRILCITLFHFCFHFFVACVPQ